MGLTNLRKLCDIAYVSSLAHASPSQMKSSKLQHILTAGLHKADRESLLNLDAWPSDTQIITKFKARQLAVTAPQAHRWCIIVPTEPALKLQDQYYKLATRLRVGVKPIDYLGDTCKACGINIKNDEYHFMSSASNKVTL